MVDITSCERNLHTFLSNLPESKIFFLRFDKVPQQTYYAPFVQDTFYRWAVNKTPCFIRNGVSGKGWCYVYRETVLKQMVTAQLDKSTSTIHANFGNHVTAGVSRKRPNRVLMLSHYTTYDDDPFMPNIYNRNDPITCNFYLDHNTVTDNTQCEPHPVRPNVSTGTLGSTYAFDKWISILVQQLAGVYTGIVRGGIGKRGGKYLLTANQRKKYMRSQKGGVSITHKGVSFGEGVLVFMKTTYLDKVCSARPDFVTATVIYDAYQEMQPGSNKYVLVMYESDETNETATFYLDARHLLKAYYAYSEPAKATAEEKKCLAQFREMSAQHTPTFVHL